MPPKPVKAKPDALKKKTGAAGRKRKNGYQMPVHIPNGEILTDTAKQQWKIGPSIGSGGFGEIYSACRAATTGKKPEDYQYVVKIEPHSNGPLFVEMHFYMRNAKLEEIEAFRKKRGLKMLGMPNFIGNGSHELEDIKHRFLVLPKFGKDIWSIFQDNGSKFPLHTAFRLAIQMIDVLEYIQSTTYVHNDLKGANMLLGLGKTGQSQAYLVDFGLACHYTTKDYKPDPKKMHNGTIEYTSRDAHNGVPTMRGDMEILAYNLVHWSGKHLPWETQNLLTNPVKVQEAKEAFMKSVDASLGNLFESRDNCPVAILSFFKLINNLKYNDTPQYDKCRKFFEDGLKSLGKPNSGDLEFKQTAAATAASRTVQKKVTKKVLSPVSDSEDDFDQSLAPSRNAKISVRSPTKRARTAKVNYADSDDETEKTKQKSTTKQQKRPSSPSENSDGLNSPEPKKVKGRRPTVDKKSKPISAKTSSTSELVTKSTPSLIVNNEISSKGKKKNKTYQFNIELDVSIDSNVVINVKRKDREKKSRKNVVNGENGNESDDVVPGSQGCTPVAHVRTLKNVRKSPRSS